MTLFFLLYLLYILLFYTIFKNTILSAMQVMAFIWSYFIVIKFNVIQLLKTYFDNKYEALK